MENAPRYAIKLVWPDPERNKNDRDAPFYFGPFVAREKAEEAKNFVRTYQAEDPPGDRMECAVIPLEESDLSRLQSPVYLRMFLFF